MTIPIRLGPLGRRLAAAFLAVTLVALAAYASLMVIAEGHDVSRLAASQREEATGAIVSAAESAYQANGGWSGADLQPVVALSNLSSAATVLSAPDGTVLLRTGTADLVQTGGALHRTQPVVVSGDVVGRLRLAFPAGLTEPEQRLRTHLAQAAVLAALVAVLVGLAASVGLSQILARPLRRLAAAAHAIGSGDREVRIGPRAGPGELAEVAEAFDAMVVALDRAERSRQALVAEVAHELRTPVAVLQAETEALVDGIQPVTPDALESLHEEAVRLGQRIEDLQTLASADATGLSLERSLIDLSEVAGRAADSLGSRFDAAQVRLERRLAPTPVWGDARRIHQVVANLLTNSCKFTPAGGSVRLDVHPVDEHGQLVVADDGPGVPPDEQGRVFDRFYRGAVGRAAEGSGIGLAVVDQIVRAHGGDVRLASPPGGGARFVISLPGHRSSEERADRLASSSSGPTSPQTC